MTTTIAPLDARHACTFNAIANGDDDNRAARLDSVVRDLITTCSSDGRLRKIQCIKIYRNFAVVFGADISLLEAKETIDAMVTRMTTETLQTMLTGGHRVGSPTFDRLEATLKTLSPHTHLEINRVMVEALRDTLMIVPDDDIQNRL